MALQLVLYRTNFKLYTWDGWFWNKKFILYNFFKSCHFTPNYKTILRNQLHIKWSLKYLLSNYKILHWNPIPIVFNISLWLLYIPTIIFHVPNKIGYPLRIDKKPSQTYAAGVLLKLTIFYLGKFSYCLQLPKIPINKQIDRHKDRQE